MTTQYLKKFYNPISLAVGATTAGIQNLMGLVQTIVGSAKAKKLQQMLEPYQTPDEVYKVLNATKSLASEGYDPFTLNYLTSNVDQAFASSASIAKRLGADPNTLSNLFNERIQGVMKIGAENHALNMENFSKYLGALETVAANKAAEQKSKQDLIKDQLQAAVAEKQAGIQNISGGLNTALSTVSAGQISNLFTPGQQAAVGGSGGVGHVGSGSIPAINLAGGNAANNSSGIPQDLINMILQQLMFKKI